MVEGKGVECDTERKVGTMVKRTAGKDMEYMVKIKF